jgi:hypothetical protein
MADQPEHGQLSVRDQRSHEAVRKFIRGSVLIMGRTRGREYSQRGTSDIEQFRLRITIRGERVEQFSDIHAAEKRCLAPSDPKPMLETGFRHQVEGIGRFAKDEYLTDRKQVKGGVKSALGPPRPLRQSP